MHQKHQRGDNSKSIKARAHIFLPDTSSRPVLHNWEVSSKYSKRFSSNRADTKMFADGRADDARLIAISPEPFDRGIKSFCVIKIDGLRPSSIVSSDFSKQRTGRTTESKVKQP